MEANETLFNDTAATGFASGSFMLVFFLIFIVVPLLSYVVSAFLLSKIFAKANTEPWKAWVPVYNNWTMLELGGQKGFWSVLMFVPVINIAAIVFTYIAGYHIGLKLGKDGWFVLLCIFLPIVWLAWLAFDDSTWQGDNGELAPAGFGNEPPMPTSEATTSVVPDSPATPETPVVSPAEAVTDSTTVQPIQPENDNNLSEAPVASTDNQPAAEAPTPSVELPPVPNATEVPAAPTGPAMPEAPVDPTAPVAPLEPAVPDAMPNPVATANPEIDDNVLPPTDPSSAPSASGPDNQQPAGQ